MIWPQCSKKDRLKYCSLIHIRFGLILGGGSESVGIAIKHENFICIVPGSNLGRGAIIVTQVSQPEHEEIDL